MRSATLVLMLATAGVACTGGAQQTPPSPATPAQVQTDKAASAKANAQANAKASLRRPFEGLAGQHILVLPMQYLIFADSLGWGGQAPPVRVYLQTVDEEITFALRERGLQANWTFSDAVTRSAKRNVGFAADPHALEAGQLRTGAKVDDFLLREPLASQLRSLIALNDARYVLFPVELRFGNAEGTAAGQARLRIAIVDARRSQLQWAGDIVGAPANTFSPAIAADLASRLADLIAPSN